MQIHEDMRDWCTRKDAWARTGRSLSTIDRLRRIGKIREWEHPVRGLLLFIPDLGRPPQLTRRDEDLGATPRARAPVTTHDHR